MKTILPPKKNILKPHIYLRANEWIVVSFEHGRFEKAWDTLFHAFNNALNIYSWQAYGGSGMWEKSPLHERWLSYLTAQERVDYENRDAREYEEQRRICKSRNGAPQYSVGWN